MSGKKEEIGELAIALSFESQDANKQISALNKSINRTEKEFKAAGKGVKNFENTYQGLDAKIKKTTKQLEDNNKKLKVQESEHKKVAKAFELSKKKLDEMDGSIDKNSKEWKEQANLVQKNADKLAKLSTDINVTKGNINKLTSELNESKTRFEELGRKTQTLDEKLEQIGTQSELTQSELNKLGSELQQSGGYFEKLGNEINKISSDLNTCNQKIDAYQSEINKLDSVLSENKNKHSQLKKEINDVEKELSEAKSKYGENSTEANQLNQKLLSLKDSYNQVETEIEQNNKELSQYKTQLNNVQTEVNQLSKELKQMPFDKVSESLKNTGSNIKSVGQSLTAGVTLPLTAVGAAAVKVGVDFDRSMSEVKAISGSTESQFKQLTDMAQKMGRETKFSASQAAEAMTFMGMAGWGAQDMIDGLPGILNLAAAGGTELSVASDIVTDGLTAMGLSAKDSNDFVDIMAATITSANTNVEMMGETMKYAAPVAGALGITMEDLSVAIGLMGNAGIKASNAGTALRGGLTRLVEPTDDAAAMMERYGIELKKTDDGSVDFMGTIENLRDKMGNLDATTQASALATIFGKEAMSGWAAVINATDDDLSKLKSSIDGSTQSAKALEEISKITGTSMDVLKTTIEGAKPAADLFNISSNDLALAISLMSDAGINGAESGKKLGNSIKNLVNPSKEAMSAMQKYGVEILKNKDGSLDFEGTIKNLRNSLGSLDKATRDQALSAIFGAEATNEWSAIVGSSNGSFDKLSGAIENTDGKAKQIAETMQENLGGSIDTMKSSIEGALYEAFLALEPVLENVIKWITDAAKWFSNLDDSTQQTIVTIGAMAAAVGPLLMGLGQLMIVGGNTVTLLDKLKGGMGKNAVASGGLKSALGLLASPVGIGAVIVAIGGLIAMIGDNENALLKLQEKFGGFGTVIGGVCEFVSGHVQLTFGNLAIAIMGVFDIIGAIIDGPGGATVNDAFDKMTAKMKLNTEEAMGKMVLTTTRGMSQLRNATDTQLNGTVASMNTIMDAIPRIVEGKYRTASQALGQQLHNMDFTQISILQGMNDTTKMIFQGIVQGMSVEQASKKVEKNLKEMAAAGKIDADTMQKDISQAMEQMKQQMDIKTKEGADKVNTNTKNAENQAVQNAKNTKDKVSKEYNETASNIDKSTKEAGNKAKANMDKASKDVGNATNNMANEAKKGTGKLASNTDTDMKKANKAVQQSATDMYNGSKKSYSKMADVAKQESSRMHNGVRDSASAMSLKARQSASEMYRGVTTSTRLMANAAIADWNRIRSVYSQPIHGTVTKTTVLQTISKGPKSIPRDIPAISGPYKIPSEANLKLRSVNLANFAMPRIDTSQYLTRGSYYNSNSYNSSLSNVVNNSSNKNLESKLDKLISLMSDLLYQKEEGNKNISAELRITDETGRYLAEIIAPHGSIIDDYKIDRDPRF